MKKVGIMQPYFFPYIGYFSLIKHTDEFILLDTVQFMRHGWIERNRVLKQNEGWLYIKVPLVKHSHDTLIKDLKVDNTQRWQERILAQLQPYKKTAPYFNEVIELVDNVISQPCDSLVELNKSTLAAVAEYIGIQKELRVFSEMKLNIETPKAADEWALNIAKAMGDVDEYWNPPGGKDFFNANKYGDADIKLRFQSVDLLEYDQKRKPFEPGLSIIDVMMFNSREEINAMLDKFKLE